METGIAFAEVLYKNKSLKFLNFSRSEIHCAAVVAVAEAIYKNTALTFLGLSSYRLLLRSENALVKVLSKNNLASLNLCRVSGFH
ncbi:hypothetical protein F8M41_020572 [Gigaspora margarita]|uniref:Uncharacterized protein n=1 Tax=Gigaspora margarita TaxID=4874 RepID=A0A8H4B1Z0_GIGMA|nr:hypothetical protein F8M41_020572 [Gigaspora margarita]